MTNAKSDKNNAAFFRMLNKSLINLQCDEEQAHFTFSVIGSVAFHLSKLYFCHR